jgi:hypothetical protein
VDLAVDLAHLQLLAVLELPAQYKDLTVVVDHQPTVVVVAVVVVALSE